MMKRTIQSIHAREILDSRGNPTVEAVVILNDGSAGRASVPSGASTGSFEVPEMRDHDLSRYLGKGALSAVKEISSQIAPALCGVHVSCQQEIDALLTELTSENPASNVTLPVSIACAKAAAISYHLPLRQYLGGVCADTLPMPLMNILNGGVHADNLLDVQEFMIMPIGATCFSQALEWCCRVYHRLKQLLQEKKLSTSVGDEGGFAPQLASEEEALELILSAIERAGLIAGKDIVLGIDAAASEWATLPCQDTNIFETNYTLPKSHLSFTSEQLISRWETLCTKYPIAFLEDPLGENDWQGFVQITHRLENHVQIVGDDLFVTNPKRIQEGIERKAANSVLIKPNQIGTLTQTAKAVSIAHRAGFLACLSHRSGDTEDSFIADLAVALGVEELKSGAPCRGERTAKYNELLRIEERLGSSACLAKPKL